jgi:hypothetical protein
MIPHFREYLHTDPTQNAPEEIDELVGEEDRNLDMLMKHAVRSSGWLAHDPKQVWQRLSERVRGPNGELAVEEPANLGSSEMPYPEQYEKADRRDSRPDAHHHSLHRLANEAYSLR